MANLNLHINIDEEKFNEMFADCMEKFEQGNPDFVEVVRCCECDYHDHDGATGFCNYWGKWSNMSDYCNHGKRKGGESNG